VQERKELATTSAVCLNRASLAAPWSGGEGPGVGGEGRRRRGLDGRGRKGRQVEEEAAKMLRGRRLRGGSGMWLGFDVCNFLLYE
jgi:hypothetical protein